MADLVVLVVFVLLFTLKLAFEADCASQINLEAANSSSKWHNSH